MRATHDGRIAVVTGASAGIGEAIARQLSEAGASVIANARRAERLNELTESNARIIACPGNAADVATVGALFQTAHDAFGSDPDLVVVNAGRGLAGSVSTSDDGEWEEMIRINVLGAARLMRMAAERMQAARAAHGSDWQSHPLDIVVLGSNVGKHISPFSSMYGATKFGVNSLAEALRRELAPKGIRVSLIAPGIVRSEFQAVAGYNPESFGALMDKFSPVLEPDDVARVVCFVTSQPMHVHLNDVLIRPTRQDYP